MVIRVTKIAFGKLPNCCRLADCAPWKSREPWLRFVRSRRVMVPIER
jgi:hypothetical protein